MKLSLNNHLDSVLIHSCVLAATENGETRYSLRIADQWYQQSLIVTPRSVKLWAVHTISDLSIGDFQQFAELDIEVVILGLGTPTAFKQGGFPPAAITQPLMPKRIGLEVMDTAAACRTYNLLVSDQRKVVAALIT